MSFVNHGVLPPMTPKRVAVMAALCYALLTWAAWGSFVLERGLHAETTWIELSQERPSLDAFLYPGDVDRIFMSLPFHTAYIFSNGSYLSLHILYGCSIWLTGFLTFLLVRALLPGSDLLAFATGAVALTHGADMSLMGVYMIVVRQAVVMILAAVLLFLMAWRRRAPGFLLAVVVAQVISLWTYEPGLPMLLFVPLLIWQRGVSFSRWATWALAFCAVPLVKIGFLLYRYLVLHAESYQSAQLFRGEWSIWFAPLILARFVFDGLAVWTWPVDWLGPFSQGCTPEFLNRATFPLTIGVAGFLIAAVLINRFAGSSRDGVPLGRAIGVAAGFLVLSYLAFVPLATLAHWGLPGKMSWRTQFFAAVPSAAVLVTTVYVAARQLRMRWVFVVVSALMVGTGVLVGVGAQLVENHRWAISRNVMAAIVRQAPRIKDDTLVLLTNVPARFSFSLCENDPPSDPFGSPMWFNANLQVLYPRTRLVGLYFRDDGTGRDRDFTFKFDPAGARLVSSRIGLEGDRFGYDEILAFKFDRDKRAELLREFPWQDIPGSVDARSYNPTGRIDFHPPPLETVRKLGLAGRMFSAPRPASVDPSQVSKSMVLLDWDKESLRAKASASFYGLSLLWPKAPLISRGGHVFYKTRSQRDHLATPLVPVEDTPTTGNAYVVVKVWSDDGSGDEAAGEIVLQDDHYTVLDRAGLAGLNPGETLALRVPRESTLRAVRVIFYGVPFEEVILPRRITIEEVRLK